MFEVSFWFLKQGGPLSTLSVMVSANDHACSKLCAFDENISKVSAPVFVFWSADGQHGGAFRTSSPSPIGRRSASRRLPVRRTGLPAPPSTSVTGRRTSRSAPRRPAGGGFGVARRHRSGRCARHLQGGLLVRRAIEAVRGVRPCHRCRRGLHQGRRRPGPPGGSAAGGVGRA